MELFGGFMVMLWMVGFFLTVIWFILPFVIFSIKGRTEEVLQRIELVESRLAAIEQALANLPAKLQQ
jgi:hypothetical protein